MLWAYLTRFCPSLGAAKDIWFLLEEKDVWKLRSGAQRCTSLLGQLCFSVFVVNKSRKYRLVCTYVFTIHTHDWYVRMYLSIDWSFYLIHSRGHVQFQPQTAGHSLSSPHYTYSFFSTRKTLASIILNLPPCSLSSLCTYPRCWLWGSPPSLGPPAPTRSLNTRSRPRSPFPRPQTGRDLGAPHGPQLCHYLLKVDSAVQIESVSAEQLVWIL